MNLLQAVNQNDVERVKKILASTANINAADNHNFTALHHAVVKRNVEICRLLLDHQRFNSLSVSFEGLSALMVGITTNCPFEILELLVLKKPQIVNIKNNEEVAPLHEAVKNKRLEVVRLLIENGATANCYDLDLENCLHFAASNCDFDMIEYILNETEVDPRAKNRDSMNPLCLLLVRSRNEPADIVSACFHLMLEHTYEKDFRINNYKVEDLFQPAFLATVYSHTEIVKFIIHNIYSSSNKKYEFIRNLCESCTVDEDEEFLYYLLVFLHDDIDKYDKFNFPRFSEINYFMCIRSVVYVLQKLLESHESVTLAISLLNVLETIEMNIKVREFEDQVGVLLYDRFSSATFAPSHIENIDRLLQYFFNKGFNISTTIKSVLHSTAVANVNQTNVFNSALEVLKIILPYNSTFFTDAECWKQINEFKNLNENISKIVTWLNDNYGNSMTNRILDVKIVYTLKHLCRNVLRNQLTGNLKLLHQADFATQLKLPHILMNFLIFKE
ncbi:hypothetical protein ACKWTF_005293 [Chironomus riparius]